MTESQKKRYEALKEIGWELDDLHISGRMDFDSFKRLFLRGLEAAGDDTDPLEMFMPEIQDSSWLDWMTEQLQQHHASRRVA